MSDQKQTRLMPVLRRPSPLPFIITPADKGQPSVIALCGHKVWRVECIVLHDKVVRQSDPKFSSWLAILPNWLRRKFAPAECTRCSLASKFEAAIECAFCHDAIFPGDPVSVYIPLKRSEEFDARATFTRNGFVGCMYSTCCPTKDFFAGYWTEEGILTFPFFSRVL